MFSVGQVRTPGVTLTNGFLPKTSPDQAPVYSESDVVQISQGNWGRDGFFNRGKDVVYDYETGGRPMEQWSEWGPNSADLAKTTLVSGYNSWELMRESLRPFKNQVRLKADRRCSPAAYLTKIMER
jgi:hypothetical protein